MFFRVLRDYFYSIWKLLGVLIPPPPPDKIPNRWRSKRRNESAKISIKYYPLFPSGIAFTALSSCYFGALVSALGTSRKIHAVAHVHFLFLDIVKWSNLKLQIVEENLITESADPRPRSLVVNGLQMSLQLFKLWKSLLATLLCAAVDLVLVGHVVLGFGVTIKLLVAEQTADFGVLALVLWLNVGAGRKPWQVSRWL